MKQIEVNYEYKKTTGEVVIYNDRRPLWLVLSEECKTEEHLKQLVKSEVSKYDELRGVAHWVKNNRKREFYQAIEKIFENLATSERDEGLKDPAFINEFYSAVRDGEGLYWLSPAHINLAIKRGMHGAYNDANKVYGNKITVRHLMGWVVNFTNVWSHRSVEDYENKKLSQPDDSHYSQGLKDLSIFKKND